MGSNLYFAYSIKRDYNGLASLLPTVLPPIQEKKKKKTRACDACSVRKTKCDESRPCRHCVNNNLECTELRQRKKSGPKNLRQKTIDSIQSISKDATSQSPERDDSAGSSDSTVPGLHSVDFNTVVEHLRSLSPEVLAALASFTVESFASSAPDFMWNLSSSPVAGAGLPFLAKRLAALSYVSVMLAVSRHAANGDVIAEKSGQSISQMWSLLQSHIIANYCDCARLLLFLVDGNGLDFDSQYYLALAGLHMYANSMLMSNAHSQGFIHLQRAVSYYRLLECHQDKDDGLVRHLRLALYVWVRHAFLFSPEPAFRSIGVVVGPVDSYSGTHPYQTALEVYHALLVSLDKLLVFEHVVPEACTWRYLASPTGMALTYVTAKHKLQECLQNVNAGDLILTAVAQLINFMLSLKVVQIFLKELDQAQVAMELLGLIKQINAVLVPTDPNLRIYVDILAVVPQMLEVLRCYLQITAGEQLGPHIIDSLLQLSSCISFYINHEFEMKDPILNDWFGRLIGPHNNLFLDGVLHET